MRRRLLATLIATGAAAATGGAAAAGRSTGPAPAEPGRELGAARSTALRRKVAVATWNPPYEGRLMTRLVVDADPVLDYVAARRAAGAKGLTAMHVVGAAAARALRAVPETNARVVHGRVVQHEQVAVGFAVDIGGGADLAPVKVVGADELTPAQVATEVWRGVTALRRGEDAGFNASSRIAERVPAPLLRPLLRVSSYVLGGLGRPLLGQNGSPLGAVFISNVAPLGVEEVFLAPVPFARASAYIALGVVTERAVVREGVVVPVRQFTLCLTGDHRIIDGVQCARYFAVLLGHLADPDGMG